MYLAFEKNSLTNSSIAFSKFPNRLAQSLASKILGMKVFPKVLNLTTHSTMEVAFSKMLKWVYESRGVLNLSRFKSLDDRDERQVRLAIRDDEISVTISFHLDDQWDICRRTNTQQRSKCTDTRHEHQLDQIHESQKMETQWDLDRDITLT